MESEPEWKSLICLTCETAWAWNARVGAAAAQGFIAHSDGGICVIFPLQVDEILGGKEGRGRSKEPCLEIVMF